MRFFPAEPDISTIFNRIRDGDIDLQPDFQRGEVWPVSKQQRLIDTILRGWVVPPVLLVSSGQGHRQHVLDGQQRLAAIRDFKLNRFSIDGRIKPHDDSIVQLHGLRYRDLPSDIAKGFDRTPVRLYEVADYKPEEPAEIFFRLNQPTVLTSAEKRNAFFGPVRDQIRALVVEFESGIDEVLYTGATLEEHDAAKLIGFSNSRMAYDDVFARYVCTLEYGTLRRKVTASGVNELYRRSEPLTKNIYLRAQQCVSLTRDVILQSRLQQTPAKSPKLNKATLYSWLIFLSRLDTQLPASVLAGFYAHFESVRSHVFSDAGASHRAEGAIASTGLIHHLMQVYTDRAGSRVSDVSSVLLRDFCAWAFWRLSNGNSLARCTDPAFARIDAYLDAPSQYHYEQSTVEFLDHIDWGARI